MTVINSSIVGIDATVVGNFNPAILRHIFLVEECHIDDLGDPIEQSPPLPMVSHIKYKDVWWTVELNRMTVRDLTLTDKAPTLLLKYLDTLPHTPLKAAGINFFGTFLVSNDCLETSGILNPSVVYKKLREFGASTIYTTVKQFLVNESSFVPMEYTINYTGDHGSQVSLQMNLSQNPSINVSYNWEVQGLDDNRQKLVYVRDEYHLIKSSFIPLLNRLLD